MKSASIVSSICVTVSLAACSPDGPAEPTDILGQSAEGKVMCVNPDAAAKTCSAIASYSPSWTGTVIETAEVLIPGEGPTTMEMSSQADVEGGRSCGEFNEADIRKSIFRFNGSPVPPAQNEAAVEKLLAAISPAFGRTICEELRLDQGQLQKFGSVEGINIALPVKPVAWISPDAGYLVAP